MASAWGIPLRPWPLFWLRTWGSSEPTTPLISPDCQSPVLSSIGLSGPWELAAEPRDRDRMQGLRSPRPSLRVARCQEEPRARTAGARPAAWEQTLVGSAVGSATSRRAARRRPAGGWPEQEPRGRRKRVSKEGWEGSHGKMPAER